MTDDDLTIFFFLKERKNKTKRSFEFPRCDLEEIRKALFYR